MIEAKETVITENTELHPDILYSTLLAININMAVAAIEKGTNDENVSRALATSVQLHNVIAMASALVICVRPLIVDKTIDFTSAVKAMYEKKEELNSQMDLEHVTKLLEGALDLGMSKIILDS